MSEAKKNVMTLAKFAKKNDISRSTIWRWTTSKHLEKRLKMYDARMIRVAGKIFIEQTSAAHGKKGTKSAI